MFQLKAASAASKWVPVDLGGESLELQLRRPTLGEVLEFEGLAAQGDKAASHEYALRCCVVGWRGVVDDAGAEVPFSWELFAQAAVADGLLRKRAYIEAAKLFLGLSETDRKNSEPPAIGGSPGSPTSPTAGEIPLPCGAD